MVLLAWEKQMTMQQRRVMLLGTYAYESTQCSFLTCSFEAAPVIPDSGILRPAPLVGTQFSISVQSLHVERAKLLETRQYLWTSVNWPASGYLRGRCNLSKIQ